MNLIRETLEAVQGSYFTWQAPDVGVHKVVAVSGKFTADATVGDRGLTFSHTTAAGTVVARYTLIKVQASGEVRWSLACGVGAIVGESIGTSGPCGPVPSAFFGPGDKLKVTDSQAVSGGDLHELFMITYHKVE